MNTIGAIFEEDNAYGVGVVIRDWRERFIAGKSMKIAGLIEVFGAKTMAAKGEIKLAMELGIRALILESDAQLVIESFGSSSDDLSHNAFILIKAFRLDLGLNYFEAQYTPRCFNSIANRLAKLAKEWDTVSKTC